MRPELEAAVAAVRAAQSRLAGRAGNEQVVSKGGRDVVTAADIAAEDAIRDLLLHRFPDYPVVGEERGGQPAAASNPYWLVDPLCGTRPFASGLPTYCTNIALVEDGQVTAAAIGDGTSADVYLAELGQGACILRPAGMHRIGASDGSPILWVDPADKEMGPWTSHAAEFLRLALLSDRWYLWQLGTTLSLAWLAKGSVAGVVYFHMNAPLHTAAGCLVASEAGAVVTDIAGDPWTLQSQTVLAASSPALQEDLVALVRMARAPDQDLLA